jgi:DNA-binding transcriptional LysR family regulator
LARPGVDARCIHRSAGQPTPRACTRMLGSARVQPRRDEPYDSQVCRARKENPVDRLTSLTVFTRVVESGGFSAAAQRLGMSPAAVTNHMQALENRMGVRLINRTTRKMSLTDVGQAYYQRCTQILAELEEAEQAASASQEVPRGKLRVHCNTHVVRFIAPLVTEFLESNPDVSIDLRTGERLPDLVEEGFDLAIHTTPSAGSSLIVRRFLTWRHILCCAPSYLESHPAPVCPADLADHNCLRYAFYPFGDEWHFIAPDGTPSNVRVSGNLLTSSLELLRVTASKGGGVLLAPCLFIRKEIETGALLPLMPEYRTIEFGLSAMYPHRRHLPAKVRSFIDLLVERFSEHERWMEPIEAYLDVPRLGAANWHELMETESEWLLPPATEPPARGILKKVGSVSM